MKLTTIEMGRLKTLDAQMASIGHVVDPESYEQLRQRFRASIEPLPLVGYAEERTRRYGNGSTK
jgi:hypothetical protein